MSSRDLWLSLHLTGSLPILVDQQAAAVRTEATAVVGTSLLIIVLLALAFRVVPCTAHRGGTRRSRVGTGGTVDRRIDHVGVDISSLLQLLLTALVLGAGTDYGLFLLFRYRENLATGMPTDEAIVAAVVGGDVHHLLRVDRRLCPPQPLAGELRPLPGVGPGLAIGIGIVLVVELTLLPALLSIVGPRLFWPSGCLESRGTGVSGRMAGRVVRQPVRALVGGVLILGVLSSFLLGYAPSGFNPGGAIAGSDSSRGQMALKEHFGEIAVGATDVVFRFPSSVWTAPVLLDRAEDELLASGRFSSVTGPLDAGGRSLPPRAVSYLYATLGPPEHLPLVDTKAPGDLPAPLYAAYRAMAQYMTENGRTVLFQTLLRAGSAGSTAAMQAIPSVRAAALGVARSVGATRAVGCNGTGTRRCRREHHLEPGRSAHPPCRDAGAHLAPRIVVAQRGGTALSGRQRGALLHRVARPRRG